MGFRSHDPTFGLGRRGIKRITLSKLLTTVLISIGLCLILYEGWQSRKEHLIKELQDDQLGFARYLRRNPCPQKQNRLAGRGIVICAGGNKLLINTFVSVKVLRTTLNSTLPIEIYHNGPDDVGPATRAIFKEFQDVTFVDLTKAALPQGHRRPRKWKSYMWKIFSLYLTNFEEVLLLDADSQPLRDPAQLFSSRQFQQDGNLFWPDYWGAGTSEAPKEEVYKWLGLPAPWRTNPAWSCGESGQLLLDKRRHADVVEWLWFLNSHAELLYKHMLGDKDTFEMAFMLADKHPLYQRVLVSPGIPLSGPKYPLYHQLWFFTQFRFPHEKTRYLRLGMLQYGPDLLPSFLHRTERTKFADWKRGYDLETMKPQFFVPSLGPNVTKWEKELMWNAHSIPAGMVDLKGEHCVLTPQQKAILEALPGRFIPGHPDGKECWYSHGGAGVAKQPIFPASFLGNSISLSVLKGIAAYEELASRLDTRIRMKMSP